MVKLSQELKNFSRHPEALPQSSIMSSFDSILEDTTTTTSSTSDQGTTAGTISKSTKWDPAQTNHPRLGSVPRHYFYSASDNSSFDNHLKQISPLKLKAKPKTPLINKKLNPYIPPSSKSSNWSGIVDLRDPSVLTPSKRRSDRAPANLSTTTPRASSDDDDDSFEALPPGMSPPVLMSPVRPPRSTAELNLLRIGQTPMREASERIQRDLIMSALKSVRKSGVKGGKQPQRQFAVDSSMSTVPTPPSLSRYMRRGDYSTTNTSIGKDPSLDSMIRNLRQDVKSSKMPSASVRPQQSTPIIEPTTPLDSRRLVDDSLDSDSDSMDSLNNTAHPSAAFLMASGGVPPYIDDDSFGSSNHSSDSLENEDVGGLGEGIMPVHPFASNAAVVDDGFDDDDDDSSDGFEVSPAGGIGVEATDDFEDETVFGVGRQNAGAAYGGQDLRMVGEDLLQDTIGIGAHLAATGRVEESPTPAGWGR